MNALQTTALALGAVLACSGLQAQVPTKCLEIESILVDACISATDCPASTEGMNEMVRFITGPAPIALSDLQFEFFSSTFQGLVQNSTTAALTSQLNASIQGCGWLLEPPGGMIPAGKEVIFITSTDMCVQANSFADLSDTLYIIFQAPGNSQGHFKNNDLVGQALTNTPGPVLSRWLHISVAGTGCGDTATYDAGKLTNIYGTYGGTSAENDGAAVDFSWPGMPVASYVNHGCMAAITPTEPIITYGGDALACGTIASLLGSVNGTYSTVHWQGGSGYFTAPDSLNTGYLPGAADSGQVQLSFCAMGSCGDSTCAFMLLLVVPGPEASFTWTAAGSEVQFQNTSALGTSWAWAFGDAAGSGSTQESPAFNFPGPGCYPVTLVAMNTTNCADSASALVCIAGADSLVVPNIFTPNSDGSNDVFAITGGDLASLDVRIYNRWGQLEAWLEHPRQVWDGHSPAGQACSPGTYFYVLRAASKSGETIDRSGTITLVH